MPRDGWSSIMVGADTLSSVVSPLSASHNWRKALLPEPALILIFWNSNFQIFTNYSLKIGVLTCDGAHPIRPSPTFSMQPLPFKELQSIYIILRKPHLHDKVWAVIYSLYFADAGEANASIMAKSSESCCPLTKWITKITRPWKITAQAKLCTGRRSARRREWEEE